MDRKEKPRARHKSEFSNTGEVNDTDAAALDSPTGREDHLGLVESRKVAASEINKPVGAKPRSEVTGLHDAGSGANETADGLSDSDETLRKEAEDSPSGEEPDTTDEIPVFDRRDVLPKV